MSHEHIQVAAREGVLTIALDRPDVLNSLNAGMCAELVEALRAAATDDAVRCVRLIGNGRAFCAGQDLADVLPTADRPAPDLGEVVARQYTPIVLAIRTMEKPVVCAVNGVAAGAGANIAFACDLVIASEDASFIQSFSRIGLIPDSGGTLLLPRLVGLQRAAALVMLGDRLEARRAREWGLVHDVVPLAVLGDTSFEISRRLACMPTRALGLAKRGFNAGLDNDLATQLALEEELQREAGRTEDYAEGVRAFIEKRKPVFRGR
jgi:2-(1,2-epoxy-1,2-dihydrophenyl)acetyl-CoA isomerase